MTRPDAGDVDPGALFEPGEALSRSHPSYEHRPGQATMARAVGRTLDEGGRLMVEAGTGTGKTLAYLVPAILSGRRVIVSTGTRNLQDQIHRHELPFLRERLGLDFSACVMKGRDNYLCRYRLAQFAHEPMFQDLREKDWVPRIVEWSTHTGSGDRAELADMPDDLKLWRDVNAKSDTCTGTKCPEYEDCWLTRIKREAQDSQVIVVNHHLFFADLALRSAYGAVLPDYDAVVFDEAHLIEEVATLYFGTQVSTGMLEDVARTAEKLAAKAGGPPKGGCGAAQLREATAEFFEPLRDRLRNAKGRVRFEPTDRGGPDLEVEWAVLSNALDEVVRQSARFAGNLLRTGEGEAESLPQRAKELHESMTRVLDRRDPAFVYGVEQRGMRTVVLTASPIDVSESLREVLFSRLHASVLTSATMAVDDKFDFFRERLGLDDAETLVVDSSFEHERQAMLYLPPRMPEPRDRDFIARCMDEIVDLLDVTEGRAFLLFTSYANMRRVHEELERIDRWPLFLQGQGSRAALVEEFKETAGAVLCGTTSFWHGVDVPGEALSLVIVDKLPYDVPNDPLIAARIERIKAEGGNPFMEYQTPLAVLDLKQGLGRLIRSKADRGLLAVLDPRIVTKRYGKTFLRSLPPWPVVRDVGAAHEFFHGAVATTPAVPVAETPPAPQDDEPPF